MDPTVSVIVPVYNGGACFRRCLESLLATNPRPLEIIVVANGDDGSAALAEQFGARVIRLPNPAGPAVARNTGAKIANGDILFFVDADVAIQVDTIARVAGSFSQVLEPSAVMGSYDDAPGAPNFLSQYKNLVNHYVHQTADEKASTFWGACGAIRRSAFLAIGGFDSCYRWIEDIELGYRLSRAGFQIRLDKDLQVKHLKRWGCYSLLKADFWYRAVPWTELILRDGHFVNDLNLRMNQRLSVCLLYGFCGTAVAAWWWPKSLVLGIVMLCVLLFINAPLYRFFYAKRGLLFALKSIPWHWLYFFYSGVAFGVGICRHFWEKSALLQMRRSKPVGD
jgi:glycosyltransferase involved in cell wall biosynthesis